MQLRWATEPLHARLFLVYLCVAFCIVLVWSFRLVRRLYSLPRSRSISLRAGDLSSESVADLALCNRVVDEALHADRATPTASGAIPPGLQMTSLHRADARFRLRIQECYADALSMKRIAMLTLIVTASVVAYGAFPTWNDLFNNANITGTMAIFRTIWLLCARLGLGLILCSLLYGLSAGFRRTIIRRQASWDYLRTIYADETALPLPEKDIPPVQYAP
jgi:hypothetical protein